MSFIIKDRKLHLGFIPWEKDPRYDPKIKVDPRIISPYKGNLWWWDFCQELRKKFYTEEIKDGIKFMTYCWIDGVCPKEDDLPLVPVVTSRYGEWDQNGETRSRYIYLSIKFSKEDDIKLNSIYVFQSGKCLGKFIYNENIISYKKIDWGEAPSPLGFGSSTEYLNSLAYGVSSLEILATKIKGTPGHGFRLMYEL